MGLLILLFTTHREIYKKSYSVETTYLLGLGHQRDHVGKFYFTKCMVWLFNSDWPTLKIYEMTFCSFRTDIYLIVTLMIDNNVYHWENCTNIAITPGKLDHVPIIPHILVLPLMKTIYRQWWCVFSLLYSICLLDLPNLGQDVPVVIPHHSNCINVNDIAKIENWIQRIRKAKVTVTYKWCTFVIVKYNTDIAYSFIHVGS